MTHGRREGGGRRAGAALAAGVWLAAAVAGGQTGEAVSEERLRATIVLQVTKFVEWPEGGERGAFRVCVLGGGRILGAIGEAAEGQERGGRKVEVVTIEKAGQVAGCRVVYVAAVAEREVEALLQNGGPAVLTVSSREGFGRQGGMVNLVASGGRIAIELNPGAGERVGIRFSSRLLQLSRLVRTGVAP